jgi:hypothetical protein
VPYRPRTGTAGVVSHVLNRAVRRDRLFDSISDYRAFLKVIAQAQARIPQPDNWLDLVNHVETTPVRDIRRSVARNLPYGNEDWRKDLGCLFEEPKRHPRS